MRNWFALFDGWVFGFFKAANLLNKFHLNILTRNHTSVRSEIVSGFLHAASNHYSFDELAYKFFEEDIDDFCGIPRPAKWLKKNRRLRKLFKNAGWWVRLFWRHCLAYLFYFRCFLSYFFGKKPFDSCGWMSSNKVLSLAICSRSVAVIDQTVVDDQGKTWLTFPWEDVAGQVGRGNGKIIDCVSVLSRKQLVQALFYAFAAHGSLKKCENGNIIMQSYTAFDWVVVYIAIKNLAPKTLITSEHHDRWAVLVDTYCTSMLKSGGKVGFSLVQHGLEYEETYIDMANNTKSGGLPYKLKCVTDVCLYGEEQYAIFDKSIISENSCNKFIGVSYFTPKINLYHAGSDGRVGVLFVGHTACEDLQVKIYNCVSGIFEFDFFYKPHPTAKMNKELLALGWQVVEGKLNFPRVDFLISYQSTLVDEYKAMGVDAFVHPMILNDGDFEAAMSELVARLRRISDVGRSE